MIYQDVPFTRMVGLCIGIAHHVQKLVEKEIGPLGLTWPQFGLLAAVQQEPGLSQQELTRLLEGDSTTTMVICDSLEKKGLVERRRDGADRRINRIHPTEGGLALAAQARALVAALYQPWLELPPGPWEDCSGILDPLYQDLGQRLAGGLKC